MYRPGTNGVLYLVFIIPFFLFASCGSAQVLGISREEASNLLRNGELDFIRSAELPADHKSAGFSRAVSVFKPLISIHPAAPFYAGLQTEDVLQTLLFCAALESPSPSARQEAVLKLVPLVLEAEDTAKNVLAFLDSSRFKGELLRAACLYRLGQHKEAEKLLLNNQEEEWGKALAIFAELKSSAEKPEALKQTASAFLFKALPGAMLSWAYREALLSGGLLAANELAVLSSKLAPRNYSALLNRLPEALGDGGIVFFRHPELLSDLGRAFQYTPASWEEGSRLFRYWDRLLSEEEGGSENIELRSFIKTLDRENLNGGKFRILFYTGRIERARGNHTESSAYFSRALELAPDGLQHDSCIWYMLMNSLAKDPLSAVSLTVETIHQWNDISYFDDILDRLSCYLTGRRQWDLLLELFHALERQDSAGASLAQYAWILGRAIQEGYVKTGLSETGDQRIEAENFFRIAFERGKGSFYHKAMAALKLGTAFMPEVLSEDPAIKPAAGKKKAERDEIDFILGFFDCGASAFALPYIQAREEKLSVQELERTAQALASSFRWKESLDLVSRYTARKDHELSRQDLLLFYPQPFRELVEKYAKETGIGPEILFGLIRTESYFMSSAVSRSGATGLAQLMAPTALEMAGRIARSGGPDYRRPGGIDLENPEINIHLGSYYLNYLTGQMGSPMAALLAYNGGMGRIRRALAANRRQGDGGVTGESLPMDIFLETIEIHETREYGRRVLGAAAVYGYLYYGMSMEEVAADIYPADIYPLNPMY